MNTTMNTTMTSIYYIQTTYCYNDGRPSVKNVGNEGFNSLISAKEFVTDLDERYGKNSLWHNETGFYIIHKVISETEWQEVRKFM